MPTPRYRIRRLAIALAGGLGPALALLLVASATPGQVGTPTAGPASRPGSTRVGPESCAARGCHGAVGPVDLLGGDAFIPGGASTTWRSHDPHARAYDVLLEGRSKAIAARLGKLLGGAPAHRAKVCLSCHASTGPEAGPAIVPRGIDCEGCHGPAGRWLDAHHTLSWKQKDATTKESLDFHDLTDAPHRARSCVGCHVGDRSRGMDVNHDLIAAGHPRLNFEYASYLAALPRHWPGPKIPADSEARAWAVGQAVTARAVLELLAARAGGSSWPELAEFECFACHHVPARPAPRLARAGAAIGPGSIPWQTWPGAMLPALAGADRTVNPADPDSAWSGLRVEMARPEPDRTRVVKLAGEGIAAIDAWLPALEKSPFDAARVSSLMTILARPHDAEPWDVEAQRYLALAALARALKDLGAGPPGPDSARVLQASPARLAFPSDRDSPRPGR